MRNPFVQGVGGVLSADIAVPDHKLELAFYSKILTTGDAPLWRDDLTNSKGTPIIGLGARIPEYAALPLQWMPHFQVADVADSVTCAVKMGGKELMHGKADDGKSQWAVLTDQFGATFGVIPVVAEEFESVRQNERTGCISWLSLTVPDATSSCDFYECVVGWNGKPVETQNSEERGAKFEMKIDEETTAAEIRRGRNEDGSLPSVWLIHLPVDDFDESLRWVRECGGDVVKEFADGQYAVIRDPVGVYLALRAGL